MVLLVAQEDVVQQRTIARQKRASNIQGHRVPQLALLGFLLDREVLELAYLILELYDEPDLSRRAEVANDEEAYHLEKAVPRQALFIPSHLRQILQLQWANLHYVADIEVLDPLCLVQEAQDVPQVNVEHTALLVAWLLSFGRALWPSR